MPAVSVRRQGIGSPERYANREGTQVENLCYGTRDALTVTTGISGPANAPGPPHRVGPKP